MKIGNLKVYGIIYKITNLMNGKIYIGQTIHGFNRRYKNNLEVYTKNSHLKSSIKKYGIDNFDVNKIIDFAFSSLELDIKEKIWIKYYKSYDDNLGYNKTTGGKTYSFVNKSRLKMSKSHKKRWKNDEYRKNLIAKLRAITSSESYRANMSKALKNSQAHREACDSEEFKEKQRKLKLELWQDEEYKKKVLKGVNESWDENRKELASDIMKERYKNEDYRDNIRQKFIERWNNPYEAERLKNNMKKRFLMVNIETKESIEFLGREALANHIGFSVSYVKKRMIKRIVYDKKFIFIRKDKMEDKEIIVDGEYWSFK